MEDFNEQQSQQQGEELYISSASVDESAENTLNSFSNFIKTFGAICSAIPVAAGFIALVTDETSFLGFLAALFIGFVILCLAFLNAALIKVFVNISLSLKDITKLLNK